MAILLNGITKIVSITSPTTEVTIQQLVNAIREWEDNYEEGMLYKKVIDAVGKADLGGSVYTAITMTLSSDWQIQFWAGVTLGFVKAGNLVGGVGDVPIKATGGSDTIVVLNQVGGIIAVSGSGITEQDKLDIADRVWDETTTGHDTSDTFGKYTMDIKSFTEFIDNIEGGRWKIISNQMIFYKADNVTEIARFNLLDSDGNPTEINVVERVRV